MMRMRIADDAWNAFDSIRHDLGMFDVVESMTPAMSDIPAGSEV